MAAAPTKLGALPVKDVRSVPKIGVWGWCVIVGPILAVPFTVIAGNAVGRLRSRGFFELVADRAEPTIQKVLD